MFSSTWPFWFNTIKNNTTDNLSSILLYSVNWVMITDLKMVPNYSILICTTWAAFFCGAVYRSSPSPSSTTTFYRGLAPWQERLVPFTSLGHPDQLVELWSEPTQVIEGIIPLTTMTSLSHIFKILKVALLLILQLFLMFIFLIWPEFANRLCP